MPPPTPPKAILFDIGGVVVLSPFQAILAYERETGIPEGYINFAIQHAAPETGAWQQLERGETTLNDAWFDAFKAQLSVPETWALFCERRGHGNRAVPAIDAKTLFWRMMRLSRTPDPYMYPALRRLRQSGRFVLAALSNTVAFPDGIVDDEGRVFSRGLVHAAAPNPHAQDSRDVADCFDVFLSSAHVGLRKPDPAAYELAVREMDRVGRAKGMGAVEAGDVLFLDDIGVNLKWARKSGLRTIKVGLGRTREAVRELEEQTGMELLGDGKARL